MKTEKEVKQKIKDTREKLSTGDLNLEEYENYVSGLVALQWVVHKNSKGEKKMAMNENNTKRLKELDRNVGHNLGLVADYKPNRISFYILLLASGRIDQLREVLYKDMEKYRSEESKLRIKNNVAL